MGLSDKLVVSRLVVLSLEEFGAGLVAVSDVGAVVDSTTMVEVSVTVSLRSTLVVSAVNMVEFGSSSEVTELLASVDVSITSVVVSVVVPEAVNVVSLAVVVVVSSGVVIVAVSLLVVAIIVSSAVLVVS